MTKWAYKTGQKLPSTMGLSKSARKKMHSLDPRTKMIMMNLLRDGMIDHVDQQLAQAPTTQPTKRTPKFSLSSSLYASGMKTLTVGEGNFSFSHALVEQFKGKGSNLVATCYDSEERLHQKYSDAAGHIKAIEAAGAKVFYGVDATQLASFPELDGPFERVVFNFPHAGLGIKDKAKSIASNQKLIHGFFASVRPFLRARGLVTLTVKKGEPYASWRVVPLATEAQLAERGHREFHPSHFPLFSHRRTAGHGAHEENNHVISAKGATTFVLGLPGITLGHKQAGKKSWKRGGKK